MKKVLKITGITLGSLILLLIIAMIIVFNFVLTPKKVTPFVNNNAQKYIGYPTKASYIDLTFFSTFPDVTLNIRDLCVLKNNSSKDTLVFVNEAFASVNLWRFLRDKDVIVNKLTLYNGLADIDMSDFETSSSGEYVEEQETLIPALIDLKELSAEKFSITYKSEEPDVLAVFKDLSLNLDGELNNSKIVADTKLKSDDVFIQMDTIQYINSEALSIELPLKIDMQGDVIEQINLELAKFSLNDLMLQVSGNVEIKENGLNLDLDYAIDGWNIDDVINVIPDAFKSLLADMTVAGVVSFGGNVKGLVGDDVMPVVSVDAKLENLSFATPDFPISLKKTVAQLSTNVDLNNLNATSLHIADLSTSTEVGDIKISGDVSDIMNDIKCNLVVDGNISIDNSLFLLPDDMPIDASGNAAVSLNILNLNVAKLQQSNFDGVKINGTIGLNNFDIDYEDIVAKSDKMSVDIVFPGEKVSKFDNFVTLKIKSEELSAAMNSNVIDAKLDGADILLNVSDILADNGKIYLDCSLNMNKIDVSMDTIQIAASDISGKYSLYPSQRNNENEENYIALSMNGLDLVAGENYAVVSDKLSLSGQIDYDSTYQNILTQWNPDFDIQLADAEVSLGGDSVFFCIDNLSANLKPDNFAIEKGNFKVGNSSFNLDGYLYNLDGYIDRTALLRGEFNFVSEYADINQLMNYVSGFGAQDTVVNEQVEVNEIIVQQETNLEPSSQEEEKIANPFMVPLGVDFVLNTNVGHAKYDDTEIRDLGGKLYIKDGIMVLEQMAFTCEAARMQLTALYRSSRVNHLFAAVDFHLLNISVKELIDMVPYVDTIVPMLKSFSGNGEFHFAFETYLFADYTPKMSTMKGAAAFNGRDLVVMDNATFNSIAKILQFNKNAENKIDSLSVEMTLFRNEVDVYPFMVSLDKYSAIVGGRHNLDMSFDYNISIMDPVILRIGVDVKGKPGNLKFIPTGRKYKDLYRPEKYNYVMLRTMELKKMINESLQLNVKE